MTARPNLLTARPIFSYRSPLADHGDSYLYLVAVRDGLVPAFLCGTHRMNLTGDQEAFGRLDLGHSFLACFAALRSSIWRFTRESP